MRTVLTDLLAIDHPIIQAGMGPFGSDAGLAAAVSNTGALGTIGAANRPPDDLRAQLARIRQLTARPYVVNLVAHAINDWNVELILEEKPPVFSYALGDPGDLVRHVHDAGICFIQQVHTVSQARLAAERGVDVIIAQGTEGGGFTGAVSTMALVPQVVDAVKPIPVVAAGGIGDGRGIAAAFMLGAVAVNLGTRFLASREADLREDWKQAILSAESEDAVKADVWRAVFPVGERQFETVPRSLRTRFIEEWQGRGEEARRRAPELAAEIGEAVQSGRMFEKVPFTGESAGLINEVLPVAEIIRRLVDETQRCLRETHAAVGVGSPEA